VGPERELHRTTLEPKPIGGTSGWCSGAATYLVNAAGATKVGLWVFSILWVSPHGTLVIASGMSTQNQGAQLFLRTADGTLQQLPWKGLTHRPNQANIIEPSIAR
jgi:hypothetical protein